MIAADPPSAREQLAEVGHRLVRRVAHAEDGHADALFDVLAERKPDGQWEQSEWLAALAELDASNLTVREWLALEDHNRRTVT